MNANQKKYCAFATSVVIAITTGGLIGYYVFNGDFWQGALIGASIPILIGTIYFIRKKINACIEEKNKNFVSETQKLLDNEFRNM